MSSRPPISVQLRERIIQWYEVEGRAISEIELLSGYKERAIYNVIRTYREYGTSENPNARQSGRPRVLDTGDLSYLSSLLLANPALYLDELQEQLACARGKEVSLATICRTLQRLAITNKTISRASAERNEELRAAWLIEYGDIPMDYFVWLDESSVDDQTNQRREGWSTMGRACVRRATFLRGQRYSILPALSIDGIIACDIFEGAVNKEKFISFIRQELAPKLTPYPGPRSVVVMDNCAIHHDEEIRSIIADECGARLIYLPPYSPDMNPIEQAFHSMKAWLRRHETAAVSAETRPWLVHQALIAISPEDAFGWITNCGYS